MTRARFRQSDVERALRGARAAGFEADEIVIEPSGAIAVRARREGADTPRDVRDEIARHFRDAKT